MPTISPELIKSLQSRPNSIRNICILAHIDHGKTTLSDSLIASNGIISPKLAGKVRYLDSREDEQKRGITMKSSAISLYFNVVTNVISKDAGKTESLSNEFLINLIDSPGHIDFSSEVSTAVRLCDGALVIVDCVEGVSSQTTAVLRQAWMEKVKPCLIFNKLDRLILELQMTPAEAYQHLKNLLEQVNAVVGTLYAAEMAQALNNKFEQGAQDPEEENGEIDLDEIDDSNIYFSPEKGNVVFASAYDGWAFSTSQFAKIYASKLGVKEDILKKTLWGDYFLDTKSKRIVGVKGSQGKLKPLFVQFVLENIWAVYNATTMNYNLEKIEKIVNSLSLKILPKDLKIKDTRTIAQTIMAKWLPISTSVLLMVVNYLPSPVTAQEMRTETIMYGNSNKTYHRNQEIESSMRSCDSSMNVPTTAFISKMVSVPRSLLPNNKRVQLTAEQLRERKKKLELLSKNSDQSDMISITETSNEKNVIEVAQYDPNEEVLIGYGRVFSGSISKGQEIYVLGPKFDPTQPNEHVSKIVVKDLYLLMGRELEELDTVPAGNIFGIGGLSEYVFKTATLSTSLNCASFNPLYFEASPIVRVALEPRHPSQMSQLVEGLKLLNQADPSVEVLVQETGEHVILTAGELHLELCLKDLKERFAKIDIECSDPIVPFRETIVSKSQSEIETATKDNKPHSEVSTCITPEKQVSLTIRAAPLPIEIANYLELNKNLIKHMTERKDEEGEYLEILEKQVLEFVAKLKELFEKSGPKWKNLFPKIMSFGPKKVGPNVLFNSTGLQHSIWAKGKLSEKIVNSFDFEQFSGEKMEFESGIVNGFQLATLYGPLCEEPLMGVAFFVEELVVDLSIEKESYGPLSGQVISLSKDACKSSLNGFSPRLMLAIYTCDIQATAEVIGKVYGVLAKRKGRIISEEMKEGTAIFIIKSVMPVVESFGFSDEIRTKTSGLASPQLLFGGWEVLEENPYWVPATEEELEDLGEKADRENIALRYMNSVRKRKGLHVEEKIVESAEKQKTLSKK